MSLYHTNCSTAERCHAQRLFSFNFTLYALFVIDEPLTLQMLNTPSTAQQPLLALNIAQWAWTTWRHHHVMMTPQVPAPAHYLQIHIQHKPLLCRHRLRLRLPSMLQRLIFPILLGYSFKFHNTDFLLQTFHYRHKQWWTSVEFAGNEFCHLIFAQCRNGCSDTYRRPSFRCISWPSVFFDDDGKYAGGVLWELMPSKGCSSDKRKRSGCLPFPPAISFLSLTK